MSRPPRDTGRNRWRAAVVALALSLFAAAIAVAAEGQPNTIVLPGALPGDAADYISSAEPALTLRVTVEGTDWAQDGNGTHVPSWEFNETEMRGRPAMVEPATTSTFAYASDGTPLFARHPKGSRNYSVEGGAGHTPYSTIQVEYYDLVFGEADHLCGLPASPGPRVLPRHGDVLLAGNCGGVLHHVADDGAKHAYGNAVTRVTFDESNPFPIEVMQDGVTISQEALGRLPTHSPQKRPASDPTVLAVHDVPANRTGPAEGGLHPEFTFARAIQAAREDFEEPGVRDYMARHPDWYVAEASSSSDDDFGAMAWSFTLDSGGAPLGVLVERYVPGPAAFPVGRPESPVPIHGGPVPPYPLNDGFSVTLHPVDRDLPALAWPQNAPNPADVANAWRAYSGVGHGPMDWGFRLECTADCRDPSAAVYAGDVRVDTAPGGNHPETASWTDSALVVDGSGRIVGRFEADVHEVRHSQPPLLIPPVSGVNAQAAPALRPSAWSTVWPAAGGLALASVAVALLTRLWPTTKSAGLAALFSRLTRRAVEDHPRRRRILSVVEADPGIHFLALGRACGLGRGALEHHVGKLVSGGLLQRRVTKGYTCFFPVDASSPALAAAGSARSQGAQRILQVVREQPGLSQKAVADRTGLDPSTVAHHVRRMAAAGWLATERRGRTVRLSPTDPATLPHGTA
ncbi:MAG: winged helix-turn-helix transcriptional regulator [Thermoplasmatota archaeon]